MVTRSQVALATTRIKTRPRKRGFSTDIFLREEFIDLLLGVTEAVGALLRLNNKPNIATAITAAVKHTAGRRRVSKDELSDKLAELKDQLRYTTDINSKEYLKIDAQIEVLVDILNCKEINAKANTHR